MSATTNLGKVSVTPKGAWAITNTYEILDIVTSGGSSYLAKQNVPTGVPLSNTSYWIMIAEKGDGGEVTSASASISGGYGTPGVSVTAGGTAHERTLAFAFTNLRGEKGETGNGINSVYKTGTSGLVDTYTILFTDGSTYEFEVNNGTASIDDTLTKSGWAADAKAVGDTKASIDGFYETMGVGVADNLTPYSEDSGASQDIPFIAQGTGCGNGESVVDTGSYCQLKKKLGNTVCVNQLAKSWSNDYTKTNVGVTGSYSAARNEWTLNGTSSGISMSQFTFDSSGMNFIKGHKYLLYTTGWTGSELTFRLWVESDSAFPFGHRMGNYGTPAIYEASNNGVTETAYVQIMAAGVVLSNVKISLKIIDLTLWHGSNDRIPSDLLSHPENWGRYYAGSLDYAAGYLDSADGSVLTSVGRNVWDEEWEIGSIDENGNNSTDNTRIRSKNYISVIPNTVYCYTVAGAAQSKKVFYYDASKNYISSEWTPALTFTIPNNACFMRFILIPQYGTTYNHDITLSLYYSGESGYDQYYPYSVLAEVDTGSEVLRGVEGSRDEKLPSGAILRKRATHTFDGTENFNVSVLSGYSQVSWLNGISLVAVDSPYISNRFITGAQGLGCVYGSTGYARVFFGLPSSVTTQAEARAWFVNNPTTLEYDLATPTTEQGTAFAENIPCDDFGSMYWTQTKGIPQGNEIFYPVDYKASIDTLYNRVEGDMSAIVIDSQLEVVADRIPEAPSEDGTYTLKATVSSGTKTYSWVADE